MYQLEKLGWTRLSNEQFDMSLIQRKGYFEIFTNKNNGLELTLFEDGGLTICGGKCTNMSPEEVKAMNIDLLSINEYKLPKDWEITKEDFTEEGFGIIHARNKIAEVQIYVDDINPVSQFRADVLIKTGHCLEHNLLSSSVERTVLVNLDAQKGEPYKVAKDLLEQCIKKVRNV